jgi:methylenetetrahydrofolate reductase (NADPH)
VKRRLLERLLSHASIEVTAHEPAVADTLQTHFSPGADVHVTYLPSDDLGVTEETCVRLRRAGYNPTPHLTARNFVDRETLERYVSRLAEYAAVTRALVIAGDVDRPRGPFTTSLDLLRTGLPGQYGIRSILIAGHPEGHPSVADPELDAALREKTAFAREHGLAIEIVTQFCFEAAPVLAWLERIRAMGIDAPVRVGVAGPANTATLLRFALRCGIGNSLRALRRRSNAIGKLLGDTSPDEVLQDLTAGFDEARHGAIGGIHIYLFGGQRKTSEWLATARRAAASADESGNTA